MTQVFQNRLLRQHQAHAWAGRAFGSASVTNPVERAARFLEEALELAQAVGLQEEQAAKIAKYVYSRPVGEVKQELGGVGVTLLVLAETVGLSVDTCEKVELERVLRIPDEHFRERHDAKAAAGIAMFTS